MNAKEKLKPSLRNSCNRLQLFQMADVPCTEMGRQWAYFNPYIKAHLFPFNPAHLIKISAETLTMLCTLLYFKRYLGGRGAYYYTAYTSILDKRTIVSYSL